MKPQSISAEALFEDHRGALRWEWVAGHAQPKRRFDDATIREAGSPADLIGYLNYIHPYRVQIVGRREVAYLNIATPEIADAIGPAATLVNLRKELDQIDQRMARLNTDKSALEERLGQPMSPADIADAGRQLKAVQDELDTLEMRWLELSEQIESMQG